MVDYVDIPCPSDTLSELIEVYDEDKNIPEIYEGKIHVTEESIERRKQRRKQRIKQLCGSIAECDGNSAHLEWKLLNVIENLPYETYIACFENGKHMVVDTLESFLMTAGPGTYPITAAADYHY